MTRRLELLFKDEVYAIVGAAMEVHRVMGCGFLEGVYQECLGLEFTVREIPFVSQPRLKIGYKGKTLRRLYTPDFLAYGEVIVELKALIAITGVEEAQIINALQASGKQVGVLINFGEPSLTWRRYIRSTK